jgi:hypothetical protein
VSRIPSRWRRGDRIFLLRGAGADMVRFVWQNADRFSLAHDVSDGGVELALAEAAAWSGLEPELVTQCHERSSGVVVALEKSVGVEWDDVLELGVV